MRMLRQLILIPCILLILITTHLAKAQSPCQTGLPDLRAVEYRYGLPTPGFDSSSFPKVVGRLEVRIENLGSGDAFNVRAKLNNHKPVNVKIIEGDVNLGDIQAGSSAWSSGDSFMIIVDMSNPQDTNLGIHWDIEYDDTCGHHHVILDIPEFPLSPG